MSELTSKDKKKLRGMAHSLNPVVLIGQHGLTDNLVKSMDQALDTHELVKVKFNDGKEERETLSKTLEEKTQSDIVGLIGNVAIFFRQNRDPEKRKIKV